MSTHVAKLTLPVGPRDHIRGPATAPVTLVEYGDLECPYCGAAYPILEELCRDLADDLRFVFRHFPLAESHPHAQLAAEAAEEAGTHQKFWEMHAMLFTHQNALEEKDLVHYAKAIGLEPQAFMHALADHRHAPRVREDFLSGMRSGVNGTPTLFIDGVRYDGPRDYDSLVAAVESAAHSEG